MFTIGDKIPGHKMKELMKLGIYFRNESNIKLYASSIKDTSLYEYTGVLSVDGDGENYEFKEVE